MKPPIPRTPFATGLSGGARQTRLRIQNILHGPKGRPPALLLAVLLVLTAGCCGLVSCRPAQDVLYAGLDALVLEIDVENEILYVCDAPGALKQTFGQRCALDCKQAAEDGRLIYVDYQSGELCTLSISQFQAGDMVIVSLYESQLTTAKDDRAQAHQVQLGTQRDPGGSAIVPDPLVEGLAGLALGDDPSRDSSDLTPLLYHSIDDLALMLVEVEGDSHVTGLDCLVLGVWNEQTEQFTGPAYTMGGDQADYTTWVGEDDALYLLWTNGSVYQGEEVSQGLGWFRFDSQGLQPIYQLPDCAVKAGILPDTPGARALLLPMRDDRNSKTFWYSHKAVLRQGGFDLYAKNPLWSASRPDQGEQWLFQGFVPLVAN